MKKISIVVRSRNDIEFIAKTLNVLASINDKDIEILSFDNNSTDGTKDVINSYANIQKFDIPEGAYVPGKILNLAFSKSSGDIIVFNNADAIPLNQDWLDELIAPLSDANVGASYARQIPRSDAQAWIKRDYSYAFSADKACDKNFFSMASSAARRDILERFKFDENIKYSEDIFWTKSLIENSYKLAYANLALVEHSHNYTLQQARKRFYGEGFADAQIYKTKQCLLHFVLSLFSGLFNDVKYCLKNSCVNDLFGFCKFRLAQKCSYYKGRRDFFK